MSAPDMTQSIAPKSDQLNAEDMLSGPRTFTIAEVRKGSDEQPVDVHLVEFPGRPFKPCKTVRRIMVIAWGADAATYTGQRMTLYRDPAVKFGGMDVGGIRVSHMTGIEKPMKVALTVSRGKRAPYIVQPLAESAPEAKFDYQGEWARETFFPALRDAEASGRVTDVKAFMSKVAGRPIGSSRDLTPAEAQQVFDAAKADDPPVVDPPQEWDGDEPPMRDDQCRAMFGNFAKMGVTDDQLQRDYLTNITGRTVESRGSLTLVEADQVLACQQRDLT